MCTWHFIVYGIISVRACWFVDFRIVFLLLSRTSKLSCLQFVIIVSISYYFNDLAYYSIITLNLSHFNTFLTRFGWFRNGVIDLKMNSRLDGRWILDIIHLGSEYGDNSILIHFPNLCLELVLIPETSFL